MEPTLKPGQKLISLNWGFSLKKGDLVALKVNGRMIVKRIQKKDDRLFFVTGDNQKMSTDSRKFGWVNKNQIVGKII